MALPRQREASRSIVLVTDGYIDAEADVFDYVREQLDDANFFAFGIGSSVNRFLIEGVARAGLGEPFIVTEPDEAPEAAAQLRRYIESPVLTGIDVTFAGFDVYDVEPGRSRTCSPAARLSSSESGAAAPPDRSRSRARPAAGRTERRSPVSPASADASHAALRHLWARTRIADLSDFGPSCAERGRVAEITSLGLTYGLLTQYTSFIAVHEVVRRTTEGADDVDQPLPLPAGVSDLAVGVTRGPNREIVWVFASSGAARVRTLRVRRLRCRSRESVCEDEARRAGRRGADRLGPEAPLRRRARGRSVVDPDSDGALGWRHDRHTFTCSRERATSRASVCF